MFKPTLKRCQIPQNTTQSTPLANSKNNHTTTLKNENTQALLVPSRLLQSPLPRSKDKTHLITPLLVLSHTYPPSVRTVLQQVDRLKPQSNRGIGAYSEVNWLFIDRKLIFWVLGDTRTEQTLFQSQIISVSITKLKATCLSTRLKNGYAVAVACQNYVSIYCLNRFQLKLTHSGMRYVMDYSLQIQKVQFIGEDQLVITSDGNCVQHILFGTEQKIRRVQVPIYRKLLPTTLLNATAKEVAQILITKDRIYLLVHQTKQKSWFQHKLDELMDDFSQPFIKTTRIEIYQYDSLAIHYTSNITEVELTRRMKTHFNEWTTPLQIQSIYLQTINRVEQELGIVTKCGWFLTLRNADRVYFSREPVPVPTSAQFGEMQIVGEKRLDPKGEARSEQNRQHEVFCSLGYHELTLTNNALLWMNDERLDGVRSEQLIGDLCVRLNDSTQCAPFSQKEWAFFTFQSYFSIRQLPFRHIIIACLHFHYLSWQQQRTISQQTAFKSHLDSLAKTITPSLLLKSLIQILISSQKSITVNNILLDMIGRQIRTQKIKDFRDLQHELKPNIPRTQININDTILTKVWNLLFELQYRESSPSSKSNNLIDTNTYWLALQHLFHQLILPLLPLTPREFKQHRQLIENVHQKILSLKSFLELKHQYEQTVRKAWAIKVGRKQTTIQQTQQLDTTDDTQYTDISWLQNSVSERISRDTLKQTTVKLQDQMRSIVITTTHLISIFFSLCDFQQPLPTFKQLLTSTHHQYTIKTVLLKRQNFHTLIKIDEEVPQLELRKDLNFIRWYNRQKTDQIATNKIDLKQLASLVTSDHFEDSLEALKARLDLYLQMLVLYEHALVNQKQSIIKQNSLQERNYANVSLFPQDQITKLRIKREYIESQISKTLDQQKKTLNKAVQQYSKAQIAKQAQHGRVLDSVMLITSTKPSLYAHMQDALRTAQNGQKFYQFQKLKAKHSQKLSCHSSPTEHSLPFNRDLFPRPPLS